MLGEILDEMLRYFNGAFEAHDAVVCYPKLLMMQLSKNNRWLK